MITEKKNGKRNCEGTYEIWRGRNPTVRSGVNAKQLSRNRQLIEKKKKRLLNLKKMYHRTVD